jgi:hypothetical protein
LQAIRTAWGTNKIEETQKRLQTIRDQLQFRILISIKEDNIRNMDEVNRKVLGDIIESNRTLTATITTQTDDIAKQQEIDGDLARQRHSEIMTAVSQHHVTTLNTNDVARKIKGELFFPRQDDRFDDIAIAHQRTFDWAMQEQDPDQSWSNLVKWLREDSGVYWISGKAGSGKSTLMKYLYQDPRLMQALKLWAGEDRLIVGTFYFWNPGADIQKSQEGLFRSLLWQVLDQDASLSSQLFPEQYLPGYKWAEFPTFHQLRRAFGRMTTQLEGTKIALVIDGLDEFDAVHLTMTGLAEMFLSAGVSPNVKALVSSRPLPSFEAAFENQPKLRLHQLTHNDIVAFVDDRLGTHPQIAELTVQSPDETKALVKEIVDAASGVFLWVKLVVDSLLEGLQNQDTIHGLHVRLRGLPKDLEKLFRHLLDGIPAEYRSESSQIFQLLRCHIQAPPNPSFSALGLSYAGTPEDIVLQTSVEPLSSTNRTKVEDVMRRRLRSRCVGLLELQPRSNTRNSNLEDEDVGVQVTQDVTYLHRSVADYLAREEVWSEILDCTKATGFNAPQILLKSSIMEAKVSVFTPMASNMCSDQGELWQLILNAMHFARMTEETTGTASLALLDDLDRAVSTHFILRPELLGENPHWGQVETWCGTWFDDRRRPTGSLDNFLSFTIEQGLNLYVCEKIKQEPKSIKKSGRPLLDYACNSGPNLNLLRPQIVQFLLRNGADANEIFLGYSPWINVLVAHHKEKTLNQRICVLKELILHGADPNACITKHIQFSRRDWRDCKQSVLRHIKWIYGTSLNEIECDNGEIKELIKLLLSKGAKEKEWHQIGDTFCKIGSLRSSCYTVWCKFRENNDISLDDNRRRWGRAFLIDDGNLYVLRKRSSK